MAAVETVHLLPEAVQDLVEAANWYEQKSIGLGREFVECIEECLQLIGSHPLMCPLAHKAYRRAKVRRFPYVIFYEPVGSAIIVYAVYHSSRDPAKWRARLP